MGTSVQINNDYITSSDVFIGTGGDSGGVSPLGSPIYPQGGFQPSSPNQGQGNYSVGDNGSGKSTFLKIIIGKLEQDSGEVMMPKGYKIGHLDQHIKFTHKTIIDDFTNHYKE